MNVIAAGLSDVGRQREHNEDSYCVLPGQRLYVVADGMGGHSAGDVASRMAIQSMAAFFEQSTEKQITWPFPFDGNLSMEENRLVTSIKLANLRIFQTSSHNPSMRGMGTTVVGFALSKDTGKMVYGHVGDSRAYRYREGELKQLTRDHSLLNDYLAIMPDAAPGDLDVPSNVITRALGMQESVVVDIGYDIPQSGDTYLLCSDGLNGMLEDDEIMKHLDMAEDDVEKAATDLVSAANEAGGDDNVTVVVARFM